ncbi:hypothetical protein GY45DRAFT_173527 [Cubamyces sp. BRFM 1775]|nr:hypothetical protein GY45DRAFT_173527 [Cubamyces sp. BRFM 1775]
MITYAQQLDFAKLFGETLFYGADCVLMIGVVYIQLTARHLLRSHKILLYTADVMFMLTTSHMALALYECLVGEVPARALQAAVAIAQFQLLLGDSVLIWRVWVVWNRDVRVILLPVVVLMAGFGILSAAEAVSYNELSKVLPVPTVILAVVNTTLCTSLIAGRLAYLDHLINGHLAFRSGHHRAYRGLILLLVESGAVLTFANIISFILERLNHPGLHAMLDISAPLANIVPTSIIVLSHFRLVPGDTANKTRQQLTETVTVRFATQIEDSACGAASVGGAIDTAETQRHGCSAAAATRTGGSLEYSPDLEKQLVAVEDVIPGVNDVRSERRRQ